MNTQSETSLSSRGRRWLCAGLIALAVGGLSVAGIGYAEGDAPPPPHEGMMGMHHGPMDPEHMQKHLDKMIEHLVPDATAQQKDKLHAIAKAAMDDLKPLHEKGRALHEQLVKLQLQPTIDHAAVEKTRQEHMQVADQISKRMTQAFTDASEVLTPAQRAKVAEEIGKHRGEHRHWHHK